jgi:hypothetical protein
MTEYFLVTTWRLQAPIEAVWDAIYHSERWPLWWRYVKQVEDIKTGNRDGLHSVRRYTWRTCLPYTLRFDLLVTRIEPCVAFEAAVSGDLEGYGRCILSSDGPVTTVNYEWNVRTCIPWMNRLAPLAKPLFEWNHQRVMQLGGEGLSRWLTDRLAAARRTQPRSSKKRIYR